MNPFKSKSPIRKSTITINSLLLTPRQKCNKSVQLGEVKKRNNTILLAKKADEKGLFDNLDCPFL